ncbi:DUF1254 domain-containing protein [Natrinema halophilum]|uniref:DUF1254 domain-containing protein n=1 Tax=Natrinema halophilum TaxID=1699371 RepID=UPI001F31022B|nr:DUF1254 domain-containing protein [Natrinema halophilum]QLG51108.2 DUF1254 domain-containing protein [Natrinema halophilum]
MSNEPPDMTEESGFEPLRATRQTALRGMSTYQGTQNSDRAADGVDLFRTRTLTRREALQKGGLIVGGLSLGGSTVTRTVAADRESEGSQESDMDSSVASIAEDAYLYGLQQIIFYVTRFNYTQKENSDVFVGVNRLYYPNDGQPITADFTAIVTPNNTTLYGMGFLDLQDDPIVIEMPEVTDRYFSLQLMNQYGIFPLYAGNQFNGTDARSYLILPDDYEGEIPGDFAATDVVQAGTKTLFTLVRYALRNPTDESEIAYVNDLQEQTNITPLSEWLANDRSGVPRVEQSVVPGDYETIPRMADLTEQQVENQTPSDFFTLLNLVLNDPSMSLIDDSRKEAAMLERLEQLGIGPGLEFDWSALDTDVQEALTSGFESGFERVRATVVEGNSDVVVDMNGWNIVQNTADFRTDWLTRAAVADFGFAGPDSPASHVGAFKFTDANGEQLNGSTQYTITFDLDNFPPVTEFWEIPIYDAQGYFVENELDRYSINSYMLEEGLLHTDANELVIYVQHEKPDDSEQVTNWLPAPEGGMRFAARFYGPHWSLVDGTYDMPEVVPAEE